VSSQQTCPGRSGPRLCRIVFGVALEVAVLERRMRPGAWSVCGFLGETESLCEVIATDDATMSDLGLTCPELAEPLGLLVRAPDACYASPFLEEFSLSEALAEMPPSWAKEAREEAEWLHAEIVRRFGTFEHADGSTAVVGARFEVELTGYCGLQECPWGGADGRETCAQATKDWRIRDTSRDLELRGSALLPHLIDKHRFFEGPASPYRLEPRALAELLELGPFSSS
jgi:hypothetical protein